MRLTVPLLLLVILEGAALLYVRSERTLYYWDQIGYWTRSMKLASALRHDPVEAWKSVARSVATEELNLLPAFPLAFWMLVFGSGRAAFIMGIVAIYLFPALLLLYGVVRELAPRASPEGVVWSCTVAVLLLAMPVVILLRGYVGIGGVFLALGVLWLALRRPVHRWKARDGALIGLGIALLFLFRRWFAFWGVALVVTVGVEALIGLVTARKGKSIYRRGAVRAVGAMVAATALLLAFLAFPRVRTVLETSYSTAFSAYRSAPGPWPALALTLEYWGAVPLVAALVAWIIWWRSGEHRRRLLVVSSMTVLPLLFFLRVQDPSPHHWLLVVPAASLLLAVPLASRLSLRSTGLTRWFMTLIPALLALSIVLPSLQRIRRRCVPVMPVKGCVPLVRQDLGEVKRLMATLGVLERRSPGPVYVLSSSGTLCDDTLRYADISRGWRFGLGPRILPAAHVDRRDGFPVSLLMARYIVLTSPVQLHLRPEDQQVVLIPWRSLVEGWGIGRSFTRLPGSFDLEDHVRAHIYVRTGQIGGAELAPLVKRFRERYPPGTGFFNRLRAYLYGAARSGG